MARQDHLHIDSAVCGVGLPITVIDDTAAYWCGFRSRISYLVQRAMLWGQHITLNT